MQKALRALSRQQWVHPVTGLAVSFAFSTIEKWFYQARGSADPVAALRRKRRADAGHQRVFSPAVIAAITALYAEYPGFSVQLHHDNLVAVSELDSTVGTVPSYSTLKRYFRSRGLVKKRKTASGHARRAPGCRSSGGHWRSEAMKRTMRSGFGIWTFMTARVVCSRSQGAGSSRSCSAFSTITRVWVATCSGTAPRIPRRWCMGSVRRSPSAGCPGP